MRCAACLDWTDDALCPGCAAAFHQPACRCARCGLALPQAEQDCLACVLQPPILQATVVAVDYTAPWDRLLQSLKFQQDTALARMLAEGLARRIRQAPQTAACLVVPLPLHPRRLSERGFNPAWELARRLGPLLGLPCRADTLLRWRDTASQARLGREARLANVVGAFMPDPSGGGHLKNQHVALVDDVVTTGATAQAAAQAILEAGARSVRLWAVARTPAPPARSADNAGHVPYRPGPS